MADKEIAERIKFLIKELNYRQVDFAQKIDVDTSNLSKYLNGRLAMSDALINKIVVNLGVSKQWLETGEDLPFAKQQPQQPSAKRSQPAKKQTKSASKSGDFRPGRARRAEVRQQRSRKKR